MEGFGRRKFIKTMGQAGAVLCMGLSQQTAFSQTKDNASKKKYKKIDVDVHIGSQEYSDYLSSLKTTSGPEAVPMPAGGQMPMQGQGQGQGQGQMPMQGQGQGQGQMPMQGQGQGQGQMPMQGQGQGQGGMPMQGQGQGQMQMSNSSAGEIEHVDLRLKDMDENGIDMQVLSWRNIGCSEFEVADGIKWGKKINNTLAELVNKYPTRFAAFCNIPWQAPDEAVKELERAVKDLGLKGIKIDSTIKGEYLDQKKFLPIFKKAQELDVPVFLHPDEMPAEMIKPYQAYSGLDGASWGYAAECSLHAIRLVYSGLFDELPRLKLMLGHMGEGVPYWLWRLESKGGSGNLKKKPSEYIRENFYINTSGMFFHPALICSYMAMGVDRVLFATDFPSESNKLAVDFIDSAPILSESDKAKICQQNAEKLFKL